MSAHFLQRTHRFILQHQMIQPGETVLVGVSGGADSLALLYALYNLRAQLDCQLHIAHLDHALRPDSAADATFVREHAERLKLPISIDRVDVRHLKDEQKRSVEDAARYARYQFYESVAKQVGATKIALGHHRGDQVETVLMNLLRGAASAGLKGILPVRDGRFIRPLLDFSRAEIEDFVVQLGLHPRQDSTNFDPNYLRNRLRLELIPLLKREYNPNLQNTLTQTAELLRAEVDYLESVAREAFEACRINADAVVLDLDIFQRYHLAVRRGVLRIAIAEASGGLAEPTFNHIESVLKLIDGKSPNRTVEMPGGLQFRRAYNQLTFQDAIAPIGEFSYQISVPGTTPLPALNAEIVASIVEGGFAEMPDGALQAVFDLDRIQLPPTIRNRRAGDRFQPFGMRGNKKVKDLLIDAKVPRHARELVPILVSGETILWVVGHRTSEAGKVAASTKRHLYLTYRTL